MKEIFNKSIIVLIILCFLSSCKGQTNEKKEKQENMKNLTLIYSVSGGTRAHIISINSKNELNYKVGSFYTNNDLDSAKIVYNENYKEVKKTLSDIDVKRINEYYLNKDKLFFNDPKIVKDSWEYYLYIDGKKVAFGRKFNYEDFPEELKKITKYILEITGKLYNIPGMS